LEDISEAPIDICPLLSIATLCTISEGTPDQISNQSGRNIPVVAFGYTADDLGEEYMSRNFQVA
jgi:hypothetical protein